MTREEFLAYAREGYNRIPVMREVLADLDTPLSTYLKLAEGSYSYLLESVHGGEKWGRYSIIGLPCQTLLRVRGNEVIMCHHDTVIEAEDHVILFLVDKNRIAEVERLFQVSVTFL